MKKYLLLFIAIILIAFPAHAAIHADTIWEVRQTATANNVNGCGFNPSNATPGTDYSRQAAAEYTGNDLASADGDAAGCVITSASHNFVDADEGNIIHITEAGTGFTVGWYEIVTTSGNAATLDRACGADGALTGGVWALGGACSLASTLDHDFFNQLVAGNTVYVLYEADHATITLGEAVTDSTDGTSTDAISLIGYATNRTKTNNDATRETIATTGANAFTLGNFVNIRNLIFTPTSATGVKTGTNSSIVNCKSTNAGGNYMAFSVGNFSVIVNSEASSTSGTAFGFLGYGTLMGSYAHDSNIGVLLNGGGNVVIDSVIDTCTTGISYATYSYSKIINNTIYAGTTCVSGTTGGGTVMLNNILSECATGATSTNLQEDTISDYNNYYSCATADRVNWPTGPNDIDADPGFTDAANADFRVGANMKAVGIPSQIPGASANCDAYVDLGAVQRVEPAGGSGGAYGF